MKANKFKMPSLIVIPAQAGISIAFLFVFFSCIACTDYVDQMEGDFDDWKEEQARASSAAAAAASASSDSALASRRGIEELFPSIDEYDVRVRAYQYELAEMDFLHLVVYNNEQKSFDSLTLRFYLDALPEEVEECAITIDMDICQIYDSTGYNKPCEKYDSVRDLMRASFPMRLDNLGRTSGGYTYYIPVPLGPIVLDAHSHVRLDIGFSSGLSNDGYKSCETLRMTPRKRMFATSGDWSWSSHVAAEDGADYAGMPLEENDYGYMMGNEIPVNPYVVVTRNGQYVSGISPSFTDRKPVSSNNSEAKSSSSSVTPQSSDSETSVSTGTMTDSRDGQTYKTVAIGTQTWMAENLNFETENSYCYKDSASYCAKYGRLYTWAAATTACPSGWHLPTKAEFETLFAAVGGKSIAGQKLKSATGWPTKSGITNEDAFAFSALPAGYRNDLGDYLNEGYNAGYWSSTEYGSYNAYSMLLDCNYGEASLYYDRNNGGFSVRCLKD